jgi:hypothetical protein
MRVAVIMAKSGHEAGPAPSVGVIETTPPGQVKPIGGVTNRRISARRAGCG